VYVVAEGVWLLLLCGGRCVAISGVGQLPLSGQLPLRSQLSLKGALSTPLRVGVVIEDWLPGGGGSLRQSARRLQRQLLLSGGCYVIVGGWRGRSCSRGSSLASGDRSDMREEGLDEVGDVLGGGGSDESGEAGLEGSRHGVLLLGSGGVGGR